MVQNDSYQVNGFYKLLMPGIFLSLFV